MKPTVPIRQTIDRICPRCKGKFENPHTTNKVCYACSLEKQIPRKYMTREAYRHEAGISIATRKPKTGNAILDSSIIIFWEIVLNKANVSRMRELEQRQGLNNSEYE